MDAVDPTANLDLGAGDRATLSKQCQDTLGAVYGHPIAHNLQWFDIIALLSEIGHVHHAPGTDVAFEIGGGHHHLHRADGKHLTLQEVMDVRTILSRAGWPPTLYERVAQTLVSAGKVVVAERGAGHSDGAHHLVDYLRLHHPEAFHAVLAEVVADASGLTGAQRLDLAGPGPGRPSPALGPA